MKSKWIVIGVLATVISFGAIAAFGSIALAQGPQGGNNNQSTGTSVGPGFGRGFDMGPGMMGGRGGFDGGLMMGGRGQTGNSLITIAAKVLGMTEADLRTALQAGKSIADVAKDKGVTLDKIVDAAVANRSDQLKQQVTAGRLTQAQSDTLLANYKINVTAELNNKFVQVGPVRESLLTIAAKELGVTEADLRTTLETGKSIADVAKDKGVALDKIVDAAVAQHADLLKQQVTAGRLTQAQADTLLANQKINITAHLNNKFVAGLPGFDGGFGFGMGGHMGHGRGGFGR